MKKLIIALLCVFCFGVANATPTSNSFDIECVSEISSDTQTSVSVEFEASQAIIALQPKYKNKRSKAKRKAGKARRKRNRQLNRRNYNGKPVCGAYL